MKHRLSAIFALFFAFSYVVTAQNAGLIITEVQPSNHATLTDEDGNYEDWIELHNPTAAPIDLTGWSLTDDATNHTKWTMSGGSIPAGGYLVVFASNKDRKTGAHLHTNFRLTATGDYLALYNPSGKRVMELNPIPRIDDDFSYGSYNGAWVDYTIPTPGTANTLNGIYRFPSPVFSVKHGVFSDPFEVTLSCPVPNAQILYTLDGSEPTLSNSTLYNKDLPIGVAGNTIVRAKVVKDPESISFLEDSRTVTQSYLFPYDIIYQSNTPFGYPAKWGKYATMADSAIADYEMDPELISNAAFADSVVKSFYNYPIVSIVTDKDNFFRKINDPVLGGIYIYTEPTENPNLDTTVLQWERPISMEYINTSDSSTLQVDCGIKLHGGASRWPEKCPKHSFRIDFRSEYGVGKLRFPILGSNSPREMNSFFLRAGFSDTWLHWNPNSDQKVATYVRDTWSKVTMSRMGNPSSKISYAHVFINGIYWGLYNPIERIDNDYSATLNGGNKEDYDVIKTEPVSASDGNMLAYNSMLAKVRKIDTIFNNATITTQEKNSASTGVFYELQGKNVDKTDNPVFPKLMNMVNFIDYMLMNYYGGNSDWDWHNWILYYNRVNPGLGFAFLGWDTENILKDVTFNRITSTSNNGPLTEMFKALVKVPSFKILLADRIQKHFFNDGWLTPVKAAQTFKDLTGMIDLALYAESARWGDYRRDVHRYSAGAGELYRPDVQYANQKKYLQTKYFPIRTDSVISQLKRQGLFPKTSAPAFKINGNSVSGDTIRMNDVLSMTGSGEIYYSLDSIDPVDWSIDGTGVVKPTALKYVAGIELQKSVVVKARALYQGVWSAMNEKALNLKVVSDLRPVPSSVSSSIAAYPVAFRDQTVFSIKLPNRSRVRLELFDTSGRKITTILDEQRNGGTGSVTFDGTRLTAGVYICRFTVDNGSKPQVLRIIKL